MNEREHVPCDVQQPHLSAGYQASSIPAVEGRHAAGEEHKTTSPTDTIQSQASGEAPSWRRIGKRHCKQQLLDAIQHRLIPLLLIPDLLRDLGALAEALPVVHPQNEGSDYPFIELSVALDITAERLDESLNILAQMLRAEHAQGWDNPRHRGSGRALAERGTTSDLPSLRGASCGSAQ